MKQKIIDFWKNSAILSQITKVENRYFRRRCENTHYTILTPNCMAGLIYSRLGEPFYSPTINTSMQNEDFIKFLSDLDYYLAQDVQEWVDDTVDYPVGIIRGRTPEDDVRVNFVHYPSFAAGREKFLAFYRAGCILKPYRVCTTSRGFIPASQAVPHRFMF